MLQSLGIERNNRWHFRQADGTVLERWTGIVVLSVAGRKTGDDVVFGEPGDLVLLGARTLEGLNLRVEPVTKLLVDAGPAPAATATCLHVDHAGLGRASSSGSAPEPRFRGEFSCRVLNPGYGAE